MLGKLMHYELEATGRTFLPLYGGILVVSAINALFMAWQLPAGIGISTLVLVSLYVALMVVFAVITVTRFYKNLLGDEGYLMNTLPVKPGHLILSKLLVSLLWVVLSGVVAVLTAMLLLAGSINWGNLSQYLGQIFQLIGEVVAKMPPEGWQVMGTMVLLLLYLLAMVIQMIMQAYASMCLSQLQPRNSWRVPTAILIYLGIGAAESIWLSLIGQVLGWGTTYLDWSFEGTASIANWVLGGCIIYALIISTIYFQICRYVLQNKLNLE